jgi:hypothetical protein
MDQRDSRCGSIVSEEVDLPRGDDFDSTRRESLVWTIQHALEDLLLARTGRDERYAVRVVDDGEGEGDADGGGLGRVGQVGDPSVLLVEELVAGEQTARVTVGTTCTA